MSVNKLTKLSRDPLLLFIISGVLIFVAYKALEANHVPTITLSTETRIQLVNEFEAITGRKATPEIIADLEQSYLTDELLFREALNTGVHLVDPTTRGSLIDIMRHRISVLVEEPTDEELVNYYSEHMQRYYSETSIGFEHHYFATVPLNGDSLLARLQSGELVNGDSFPHGNHFPATSENIIRGIFGEDFLTFLKAIKPTQWHGPIISQYGSHYVRLHKIMPGKPMPFSTARNMIKNDYMEAKINQEINDWFAAIKPRYEILIEP